LIWVGYPLLNTSQSSGAKCLLHLCLFSLHDRSQVEEPKAEPKVVDTAPAVKRVAKKTTPKKQEPKTEQVNNEE
jgi:hypothetical protein